MGVIFQCVTSNQKKIMWWRQIKQCPLWWRQIRNIVWWRQIKRFPVWWRQIRKYIEWWRQIRKYSVRWHQLRNFLSRNVKSRNIMCDGVKFIPLSCPYKCAYIDYSIISIIINLNPVSTNPGNLCGSVSCFMQQGMAPNGSLNLELPSTSIMGQLLYILARWCISLQYCCCKNKWSVIGTIVLKYYQIFAHLQILRFQKPDIWQYKRKTGGRFCENLSRIFFVRKSEEIQY